MSDALAVSGQPVVDALLDAAVSEAKRRGHDRVTPAHLAAVIREQQPDLAKATFT
ncbi:MAG: hypothetical protein QG661_3018, partial [Actinomycetota bacterium]|nr:hypothetical protein [Actinomycetota bacterium]